MIRHVDRVSTQPPRELTLRHVFHAPRTLVFQAWTEPALLAAWWGPEQFTTPVVEVDVRPGGQLYIEMRGPGGVSIPTWGTFHEVSPPTRLVFLTAALEDEHGHPQLEVLNTAVFTEAAGYTTVTLHLVILKATSAVADSLAGMQSGWQQSLNRLASSLERRSPPPTSD